MATILVKNLPEELLIELKRLKVELGCKTWANLLSELVASEEIMLKEEKNNETDTGVKNFLNLKTAVSTKWNSDSTVLEEIRRSRRHETIK
jgi:hypothetical protein